MRAVEQSVCGVMDTKLPHAARLRFRMLEDIAQDCERVVKSGLTALADIEGHA